MSGLANPVLLKDQIKNIKGANEKEVIQGREKRCYKMPHNVIQRPVKKNNEIENTSCSEATIGFCLWVTGLC